MLIVLSGCTASGGSSRRCATSASPSRQAPCWAASFVLLRHIYRVPAGRYAENLATFRELLDLTVEEPDVSDVVRRIYAGERRT